MYYILGGNAGYVFWNHKKHEARKFKSYEAAKEYLETYIKHNKPEIFQPYKIVKVEGVMRFEFCAECDEVYLAEETKEQ